VGVDPGNGDACSPTGGVTLGACGETPGCGISDFRGAHAVRRTKTIQISILFLIIHAFKMGHHGNAEGVKIYSSSIPGGDPIYFT
jgi:hypothetical protein